MSSKGFFPSLVVPTWHGFIGPKKKSGKSTVVTVSPASFTATQFGNGGSPLTIGAISQDAQIVALHTMLTPDPGSGVGSTSPGSVGGFNIVAVLNLKVGSPLNGYIIFSGSFAVPAGVTVTYLNNLSTVETSTPVVVDLSANLGAGFTSWRLNHLIKGCQSGGTFPFTITFNGI